MTAAIALQTALFAALSADTDVQAALGTPPRIYDSVPRAPTFPYATLGDATEAPWNTKTEQGTEHRLALTLWSRASGHKESKEIAATLIDTIDHATIAPEAHTLVNLTFTDGTHGLEPDGVTYRTTLHYRAVTEPQA
ncbi:MAG TPA: DUF3168 domain-containing protein [Rhizomicrobium sp.]|jgi:hypothetical protein|nr:DUF3168 domain-containing protein [Rhizomicrobium sp.]